MKIMKDDMNKVRKMLEKLKYSTSDDKDTAYIFFPIDSGYSKDIDGLEISVKNSNQTTKLTPGLVLMPSDSADTAEVYLGFADLTFCPSIETEVFISLSNPKFDKRDTAALSAYELFFVNKKYMFNIINIFHL